MKKVCNELQLHFGKCKDHSWAVLNEKRVTNRLEAHLEKVIDEVEEEQHTMILLYNAD